MASKKIHGMNLSESKLRIRNRMQSKPKRNYKVPVFSVLLLIAVFMFIASKSSLPNEQQASNRLMDADIQIEYRTFTEEEVYDHTNKYVSETFINEQYRMLTLDITVNKSAGEEVTLLYTQGLNHDELENYPYALLGISSGATNNKEETYVAIYEYFTINITNLSDEEVIDFLKEQSVTVLLEKIDGTIVEEVYMLSDLLKVAL
jgi:hypothetical protein